MKLFNIRLDRTGRLHVSEGFFEFVRDEVRKAGDPPRPAREKPPVLLLQRNADGSFGPDFRVAS